MAVESGDEQMVDILLEGGADVHERDVRGCTALMVTLEGGGGGGGVSGSGSGAEEWSPSRSSDSQAVSVSMIALLLKFGSSITASNEVHVIPCKYDATGHLFRFV